MAARSMRFAVPSPQNAAAYILRRLVIGLAATLTAITLSTAAHAGTNSWTWPYANCNEMTSTSALLACVDGIQSAGIDYCGNMRVGQGPELQWGTGPAYVVFLQWDIDPTFPYDNCDVRQATTIHGAWSWLFTPSCSPNEWNEQYGGCVPHCVAPQTLDTGDWTCGIPEGVEQHSNANGTVCKGNPCDVLTGNKMQREIDYAPRTGALAFIRTYNSLRYHSAKDGPYGKPLGESWFGSYFQFISAASGLNSGVVHAVRPNGDVIEFTATAPGSTSTEYEAEGELQDRLVVALSSGTFVGWRYITAGDDAELYDSNGRLVSIKSRGGVTQTLTYGSSSRVESVADDFGHELIFEWDSATPPRLTSVVLPGSGSGEIQFAYGSYNNLTSVSYPDSTERHYLYELTHSSQRNLLTGIEDESEVRYATWGYGVGNRVTSSAHAGSVDSYSFTYNTDGSRTVVDPLGKSVTYATQMIAGQRRYTSASSQCASCGGEHYSTTFDTAGNYESTTDFNGVETRYEHDVSRTLETERTEAYGTLNERTIVTDWHATFRLPEEINEPGRRTEFTYDSNGNVLTQTITDTARSESRTWTMTYTTLGQMLTINVSFPRFSGHHPKVSA